MGILNVPQEEADENGAIDVDSLDSTQIAVLGRRASFKRRVRRMLDVVMAEAVDSLDDAADQVSMGTSHAGKDTIAGTSSSRA